MHGVIIIANRQFEHLISIIEACDANMLLFVHVDGRSDIPKAQEEQIRNDGRIKFFSRRFSPNWGSVDLVHCTLYMMEQALNVDNIERIHLISGEDFPVKSSKEIREYFIGKEANEYINYFSLPHSNWKNGGMERLETYQLYDYLNVRKQKLLIHAFHKVQKVLRVKRHINKKFLPMYGGSQWWSLTRDCVQYVVRYSKENPQFLRRCRYCFGTDEIYIQSVVCKSPFRDKIANTNLRYISWGMRNGSSPAYLDITDLPAIENGDFIFARKFDVEISHDLKSRLIDSIHLTTN